MNSFYNDDELKIIGLKSFGKNVRISKKASLYAPSLIDIGDNVRIDDFCILSGNIQIGSYVHISAFTAIYGKSKVTLEDYSGLSPRCTVFSGIDDFSGEYLVGPLVDQNFTGLYTGPVYLGRYVQVGSGSILFPNITLKEGCAVGAMTLVKDSFDEWTIIGGIPAKFIKKRSKNLINFLNK